MIISHFLPCVLENYRLLVINNIDRYVLKTKAVDDDEDDDKDEDDEDEKEENEDN